MTIKMDYQLNSALHNLFAKSINRKINNILKGGVVGEPGFPTDEMNISKIY